MLSLNHNNIEKLTDEINKTPNNKKEFNILNQELAKMKNRTKQLNDHLQQLAAKSELNGTQKLPRTNIEKGRPETPFHSPSSAVDYQHYAFDQIGGPVRGPS